MDNIGNHCSIPVKNKCSIDEMHAYVLLNIEPSKKLTRKS